MARADVWSDGGDGLTTTGGSPRPPLATESWVAAVITGVDLPLHARIGT
jgi:hypothetical protein